MLGAGCPGGFWRPRQAARIRTERSVDLSDVLSKRSDAGHFAAELLDAQQTRDRFVISNEWARVVIARLMPLLDAKPPFKVLDVGAAQGRTVAALLRLGHEAYGVEPSAEALATSKAFGRELGLDLDIRQGVAERIPFPDASFDVVLATSVIEHVIDAEQSFAEAFRVLKPGGVFWFYSASAMCPRQGEISGFPLFGWYPNALKLRIMNWAKVHRPHLVGHTKTPAIHWWTPRKATRMLKAAGFRDVFDRWDLRRPEEQGARSYTFVRLAQRFALVRFIGDVCIWDCSYAARKARS